MSAVVAGYQVSGDRVVGLFLGLTFAGLYASSACFAVNFMPKPFDGIALGSGGAGDDLAQLAVVAGDRSRFSAVGPMNVRWSPLLFIALLVVALPQWKNKEKAHRLAAIAGSVVAYLVSRGDRLVCSRLEACGYGADRHGSAAGVYLRAIGRLVLLRGRLDADRRGHVGGCGRSEPVRGFASSPRQWRLPSARACWFSTFPGRAVLRFL